MSEVKAPEHRQAQNVAVLGLALQLACLAMLVGLAIWSGSDVIVGLARLIAVGIPIWFILFLVFKQLRRVAAEQLETAELKRAQAAGAAEAIFEVADEDLLIEQNRLRWILKWVLPATTVTLFLYLLVGQFVGWRWTFDNAFAKEGIARTEQPMLLMWFVAGVGVVSFWYSRYTIALARMPQWRLLRAGAICMAGNALACLLVAVAFMAGLSFPWAQPLAAYVLRVVLLILGIELAANFIFDFYRPRTPGVLPRPSFESRLLALFAEPGGIAKSIADAINYQFGFEVSSTWFYQLLQRWLFPIAVFACVVVLLLSSIVIVDADEQAVVERFGRVIERPGGVLEPGIHFKWPYPIDVVRRAPVRRVHELVIGEAGSQEDEHQERAILWTEAHDYVPELMLLVGAPRSQTEPVGEWLPEGAKPKGSQSVPVSLLMISVPIEYRIKNLRAYLYNYREPQKVMESLAYQFLSDYAAGVDLDSLMGPAREELNRQLRTRLQAKLDEYQTGIEIVFTGTRGAHPPAERGVAEAFLGVITAQTQRAATITAAEGEAQKILTAVAGTESRALALDEAIRKRDELHSDADSDSKARADAAAWVEDLLMGNAQKGIPPLSGKAAALVADAHAQASNDVAEAAAKVRAFKTELVAYNSAPDLFKQRKWMDIWTGLDSVRKYLIAGDASNVVIEYETEQKGGLDTVLSDEQQ